MLNEYITKDEISLISVNKKQDIWTIVDTKMLDFLNIARRTYHAKFDSNSSKNWYVRGVNYEETSKKDVIYLHRLLTGNHSNLEVDHINHNTLDNRLCNLRVVTKAQNMLV